MRIAEKFGHTNPIAEDLAFSGQLLPGSLWLYPNSTGTGLTGKNLGQEAAYRVFIDAETVQLKP